MSPRASFTSKHSAGFWVCVGLSALVVVASWVAILHDRVREEGVAIKQDIRDVASEVRTVEMNTREERQDLREVFSPITDNFNEAVTRAEKQKEAIETVTPFFEEQIK